MSVTPQTNEPEAPDGLPATERDPAELPSSLFARSPRGADADGAVVSKVHAVPVAESMDDDAKPEQFEARVVKRLVRHVSPWSVLKVSTLLYLSMYAVFMMAGIALWTIAADRGLIDSFEGFMDELLAEENFRVNGSNVLRLVATIGICGVLVASALTVLFAIIFNLISDITGGVRFSVVEMETARPRRRRRRD